MLCTTTSNKLEKGNKTARMKFNEPRILFPLSPYYYCTDISCTSTKGKAEKRSSSSADNREKLGGT
jgi:hypothetical protein